MLINKKNLRHVSSGWDRQVLSYFLNGDLVEAGDFIIDASKGHFELQKKTIQKRRLDRKHRKQKQFPT